MFLAIILGWLWWDSGDDFFSVLGLQVFGVFLTVGLNIQYTGYLFRDVAIYLNETKHDMYSPAVYWLVSLTPIAFIRACHVAIMLSIAYFMGSMQDGEAILTVMPRSPLRAAQPNLRVCACTLTVRSIRLQSVDV